MPHRFSRSQYFEEGSRGESRGAGVFEAGEVRISGDEEVGAGGPREGDEVLVFGIGGEGLRGKRGFGFCGGGAPDEVEIASDFFDAYVPAELRPKEDFLKLAEQSLRGDHIEASLEPRHEQLGGSAASAEGDAGRDEHAGIDDHPI